MSRRFFGILTIVIGVFALVAIVASYSVAYQLNPKPAISEKGSPSSIDVVTDLPAYTPDQLVNITGKVEEKQAIINIAVKSDREDLIWVDQVLADDSGYFKSTFRLSDDVSLGRYTVYATVQEARATTVFYVVRGEPT